MASQDIRYSTVLVSGATGFFGQPLVHRLSLKGYQVTALGFTSPNSPFGPEVEYLQVNLTDASCVRQALTPWRWDALVNLAGPVPKRHTVLPDDYQMLSDHVNITLNICTVIPAQWTGRLIHISGMNIYGCPEYLPVPEIHPRRPINVYGAAKALTEEIVLTLTQRENLDCWVLRLPGLFSETRQTGAIYNFMLAAIRGEPLIISAAQPTPWDVLHVADAVEAIVRVLSSDFHSVSPINISYGEAVELEVVARLIVEITQSKSKVQNTSNIRHPVFQMDISRARKLLSWPPYTLRQRLERLGREITGKAGGKSGV